jgi:hypothetical protein
VGYGAGAINPYLGFDDERYPGQRPATAPACAMSEVRRPLITAHPAGAPVEELGALRDMQKDR